MLLGKEEREGLQLARAYLRWLDGMGLEIPRQEFAGGGGAAPLSPPVPALAARADGRRTPPGGAAAPAPRPAAAAAVPEYQGELGQLQQAVRQCRKCPLGSSRTNTVFGSGNPSAGLMFIGEAPGETEDKTGLPFVGAAGRVLAEELGKNGLGREDVFIANILKCRPPGNRDPLPEEIAQCEPYLHDQIRLIKPKMLCGLGRYAVMCLLRREIGIMRVRGTWETYEGLPLFICLHPAAVIYQQANRQMFNADIAALVKAYREASGE